MTPNTIMIFAAGHGTRMGEMTRDCPKPLIPVAGRPLIDYAIELADQANIPRKLVNVHYLGQMIVDHLADRDDIRISLETGKALETGGGLKHALPFLGSNPVFALNSDAVWSGSNPVRELSECWRPDAMDALLSVTPLDDATNHRGRGDFNLDSNGRLTRFRPENGRPYIYTGAQILKTDLVRDEPQTRFSFNLIWDRMLANGRLFGCTHQGGWVDVGTPEGIKHGEALLRSSSNV